MNEIDLHDIMDVILRYWPKADTVELDLLRRKVLANCDHDKAREVIDRVKLDHEFATLPTKKLYHALSTIREKTGGPKTTTCYFLNRDESVTGFDVNYGNCLVCPMAEPEEARRHAERWLRSVRLEPSNYAIFVGEENHGLFQQERARRTQ